MSETTSFSPSQIPQNQLVVQLLAQIEAARSLIQVHNPGKPPNKQVHYPANAEKKR